MELAGAVFLPCSGYVSPDPYYGWFYGGTTASYWTSTSQSNYAYAIVMFYNYGPGTYSLHTGWSWPLNYLHSVRLVHDN